MDRTAHRPGADDLFAGDGLLDGGQIGGCGAQAGGRHGLGVISWAWRAPIQRTASSGRSNLGPAMR